MGHATLIIEERKDIELRSWSAAPGNTFYIHVPIIADQKLCREYNIIPHPPKTIIGKVQVVGVKEYTNSKDFAEDYPRHHCKSFGKYDYGFILDNMKKVEPPIENIQGKRFFFYL